MPQMTVQSLRLWCAAVERHYGPHVPVWLEYPLPTHSTDGVTCAPLMDGRVQPSPDAFAAVILTAVARPSDGHHAPRVLEADTPV